MKYKCSNCGHVFEGQQKYCSECGHRMNYINSEPSQSSVNVRISEQPSNGSTETTSINNGTLVGFLLGFFVGLIGLIIAYVMGDKKVIKGALTGFFISLIISFLFMFIVIYAYLHS